MLDEYINQSEANATLISSNYYTALAKNEKENLSQLEAEKAALLAEMEVAMASGTIAEGSEGWYELVNSIDEVTLSIEESKTQLLEYDQIIQQLSWETFDLLQEKISSVTEETEFLIDLMSNDKLFNDNGQLTDEGMATMGLHGQNYNVYMNQADQAAAEAERLRKQLEEDPYDTELEERYREMISLQQEYILAAEDEKEAIRDLVEEGINYELEALQELIDKKNEQLQSEKDLYEYSKKVKESTEEIASLEKQMAAYSGDDSEEAKQKIQQIKVDLESAKENLQETEYEKFISDSSALLDELYLEYETILNTRLDNVDALISDMIAEINADATSISTTISEKADSVGYTLSDSMKTIWDTNTTSTINVITTYGEKFTSAQTTTNNALGTINTNLQNMISQLDKIANANAKTASTSSAANSKEAKSKTTTTSDKKTDSNSNKQAITNDTLMGIASSIWIYGEDAGWGNDPIRSGKLTNKFGLSIAEKVQEYINTYGSSGKLYDFWLKKGKNLNAYKYNAFESGAKKIGLDQLAWTQEAGREFIVRPSDGAILTPVMKGDSVLTAAASNNIWNLANNPIDFIDKIIKNNPLYDIIPANSNVQSNCTQHFDEIIFNFPNVKSYDEMLSAMQKDRNFERLINSMTVDRLAGKSSLAKGKSIR